MKSNCLTCGIEFSFRPSQKTGKYCSNKCQQKYQQKKVIDDWKKDSNTKASIFWTYLMGL